MRTTTTTSTWTTASGVNNNNGVGIEDDEEGDRRCPQEEWQGGQHPCHHPAQGRSGQPERFEDASTIADHLNNKRTVVLNLESTNKEVSRRLVDFLSGVA